MKALVINNYGNEEVFTEIDVANPTIKADEVLIRVHATSVNPLDYKLRRGDFPTFTPLFPAILHLDVSGIVEEVGTQVLDLKVGDEVFGIGGGLMKYQGCLAEYVAAPAKLIVRKPNSLSIEESATLPLSALTAWEAIIDSINIKPKQNILIFGGTGGVGHIAMQLAKWRGAKVFATVGSSEKMKIAKTLGADEVINYKNEDLIKATASYTNGAGFDYIFDTVGGENLDLSLQLAKLRGHIVSLSAREEYDLSIAANKGLHLHLVNVSHPLVTGMWQEEHNATLKQIAKLVDSGIIKILMDQHSFKMNEVSMAHKLVEGGSAIGKVCLSWK